MINDSIDNIRLDLNREKVKAAVYVREGDTKTRTLHCTLTDNGRVVSLADAIVAEILISKADGYEADNSVVVVGDELQYTWRSSDLSANGENLCQFMVTYADGSVVTSPEFSLFVYRKKVNQRTQVSTNEYTSLTEQVVMAKGYASSASESAANANTAYESSSDLYEQVVAARDEAITAETNAKESEDNAKESADYVESSIAVINAVCDEAEGYKDAAAESATEASGYSDSASGYATTASTKASEASGYASAASNSASSASSSAASAASTKTYVDAAVTEAQGYASAAGTSASNAETSASTSRSWADKSQEIYESIGGQTLVLGETSTTAYRGDRGKAAYEHVSATGNPHGLTCADIGAETSGSAAAMYQQATGYTDQKIADLINGAPETLDTLKEIADAMASSAEVVEALEEAIGLKANDTEFQAHQNNDTIHVTANDKSSWNTASSEFGTHKSNTNIHITDSERQAWNQVATLKTQIETLKGMIGYPYTPVTESGD